MTIPSITKNFTFTSGTNPAFSTGNSSLFMNPPPELKPCVNCPEMTATPLEIKDGDNQVFNGCPKCLAKFINQWFKMRDVAYAGYNALREAKTALVMPMKHTEIESVCNRIDAIVK